MKRILVILIAGIMSLSLFTVNASAYTNPNVVVVRDYNGKTKISSLEIVGSTAYCESKYVDNNSSIKSIYGVQTLEKRSSSGSYTTVNGTRWTKEVNSSNMAMQNSKSGLSSGTYRLKTVFKVTFNNGKTETTTVYSLLSTIR